jgi:hypothetical protein
MAEPDTTPHAMSVVGSKAEVLALRGHVRFTPQKQTSEPFSATSALGQQATHRY